MPSLILEESSNAELLNQLRSLSLQSVLKERLNLKALENELTNHTFRAIYFLPSTETVAGGNTESAVDLKVEIFFI